MHSYDWNDLQHVLAVAEQGSLAAASRLLEVSHTTVLRRVAALESRLGVRLFERSPTGYVLTAAGEQLTIAARAMQETMTDVTRRIAGQDTRLTGTVRVTTTLTLVASVLPPLLSAFGLANPDVSLELSTSNAFANLSKRDADVAVRPSSAPPPNLVGRRIARVRFAVYASAAYLARVPARRELARHVWLGPDEALADIVLARWLRRELPEARFALRTDNLVVLRQAALAGHGVSALPCYLGDTTPGLRRIRPPVEGLETELWVLTHEDLRGTARIRALTGYLGDALAGQRDLFEGRRPLAARD